MCHVLSATFDQLLTPSINQSINQSISLLTSMRGIVLPRSSEPVAHALLSSTVRILKSSRIYESVIKYYVRKTVNPILFRLKPFWKCYLTCLNWTYCWSKFKAELNPGGGYSLNWPRRRGSTRPFSGFKYMRGLGFHFLKYVKHRENCRFGW